MYRLLSLVVAASNIPTLLRAQAPAAADRHAAAPVATAVAASGTIRIADRPTFLSSVHEPSDEHGYNHTHDTLHAGETVDPSQLRPHWRSASTQRHADAENRRARAARIARSLRAS